MIQPEQDSESFKEPSLGEEEPSKLGRNASYVSKKSITKFQREFDKTPDPMISEYSISDDGASIIFKT